MGCTSSVSAITSPEHKLSGTQQDHGNALEETPQFVKNITSDFKVSNDNFPPPKPPKESRQELLDRNKNVQVTTNKFQQQPSTPPSDRNLSEFTKETLLPEVLPALKKTPDFYNSKEPVIKIADDKSINRKLEDLQNNNLQTATNENKSFETSPKPTVPAVIRPHVSITADKNQVESQVQKKMEEHIKEKQLADEMRNQDKLRQQQSLRDKLKQRSEMKKQRLRSSENATQEVQRLSNSLPSTEETKIADHSTALAALQGDIQPSLPTEKKEALYSKDENISLFRDLESHAVNMEKLSSKDVTFAILMEELLIDQLSELEKVRIIFHWITAQNLNSIDFSSDLPEDTPLGFLYAIKLSKKSYAALFVRLCSAAGLHAKSITGNMKGVGYYPDYKFSQENEPFRGSWNGVLVDKQWRLIDTNWGARHVTEEGENSSGDWCTEYKYEEHYFLTDPDQMIVTHFPDEAEWQLLPKPYTLTEFESLTKLWPLFFKLNLQQSSHHTGVITAIDGYVRIELNVPNMVRSDAKFKAELLTRSKQRELNGVILQQYMLHYSDKNKEVFEIFFPFEGQYLLKIFGLSKKYSDENTFTNLCFYQINCSSKYHASNTKLPQPPFPVVNSQYGPILSNSNENCHPLPVSHPGPLVECDADGNAKIIMDVTGNSNIAFTQDMRDVNSGSPALRGAVVHSVIDTPSTKQVMFHIKTPHKGNYALTLYRNDFKNSANDSTFSAFCHYLVISSKQDDLTQTNMFPEIPNGKLGSIKPDFDNLKLEMVSCFPSANQDWRGGFIKTDSKGKCRITFKHAEPLTIVANLSTATTLTGLEDFTMVETTGKYTTITVHTPVQLCGELVHALKVYASSLQQTQGIPSVFTAFIIPIVHNAVDPLLQSPTRCWGPSGLRYYSHGITQVTFKNSNSSLQHDGFIPDSEIQFSGPCRIYDGGEDFEMIVEMSNPLQLKAKLTPLDGMAKQAGNQLENHVFLDMCDLKQSSLQLRLVQSGAYSLVLYASNLDDASGQLVPLIYILIQCILPSACILPFPTAFGVWTSSARKLHHPMNGELQRNEENKIRIYLGRFEKPMDTASDWSIAPYPEVALYDGSNPLVPNMISTMLYEWKYVPGPTETTVGVLVKPGLDAQSMTYALQFKVV